jgi:tetratricopeptide (TPR) repeat protein
VRPSKPVGYQYRLLIPVLLSCFCYSPARSVLAAANEEDLEKIRSLNSRVTELYQAGRCDEAISIANEAVKLAEDVLPSDHPITIIVLNNLAQQYECKGGKRDYDRAELLYQRALKVLERGDDKESLLTSAILNQLAELYRKTGQYCMAQPLYKRALAIRERLLDRQDVEISTVLNNLALLYKEMGEYAKAEPLFQRSLRIRENAPDQQQALTAIALNNLGVLYITMGYCDKAEPFYQRALTIKEQVPHPDDRSLAVALSNLASVFECKGDYAKAELFLKRALKLQENAFPGHPDTAKMLNSLGQIYQSIGDHARAKELFQRALDIQEKALRCHPEIANTLNTLASLYYEEHNYTEAEPRFQRALKIDQDALGLDHPDTASDLNNLAVLYRAMGKYAKAEPLYQRALKIDEKALGPDHPTAALNNLAELYRWTGDYAKAEPLYKDALKIDEKALGPDHPDTVKVIKNLALLKMDLGVPKDAIALVKRAQQAEERYLSNILSFTSEQQRLAFQGITYPYALFATLGNATGLTQAVLRQKGVVLDSLLEDRLVAEASHDPKQCEAIAQLRSAKQRLMRLALEVPKDLSAPAQKQRAAEKERLSTEVERLEGGLARQVGLGKARGALSVTVTQVQSTLPKQAALIELLRYDHYLGKNKLEPRYGAVVLSSTGDPRWVPLNAADDIEKNVELYRRSVRGETDEEALHSVLRKLYDQIWSPIERLLPANTKTIVFSPDAALNFVSFATLLSPTD